MKLFQQLLVAPAALGLLAPVAANAAELNINGVSDYAATGEQVTSITQFSDVYPTDWAYQALSNLIERYGCVAGYPNGTFRGNRAMTRYEAAALLNACLDRITEVTDELKRLMKEFERELAILKGRVDGLEARVGELEATQFSTTTKLKGQTAFVMGAVNAGGDDGSKYYGAWNGDTYGEYALSGYLLGLNRDFLAADLSNALNSNKGNSYTAFKRLNRNTKFSANGANGGASAYNRNYGAFTFNYDQRLILNTSFTGKDKLITVLRAGNFVKGANAFVGAGVNLTALDVATDTGSAAGVPNNVKLVRAYYKFPVGSEFTAIVGGIARNTESVAVWPSVYNKGGAKILDWTAVMGTPGVYNKATGQLIGGFWKQNVAKGENAWSISANYVTAKGGTSNTENGGFMTSNSAGNVMAQLGYAGPEWGIAFGYRYGQCGSGYRRGTEFAANGKWNNECTYQPYSTYKNADGEKFYLPATTYDKASDKYFLKDRKRSNASTNSYALNAYWQPEESGWIPSVSVGWGINQNSTDNKLDATPVTSQSWMVGLKWDDVLLQGNAMGFAFGQPTFATSLKGCKARANVYNLDKCGETPFDGNYAFEWYYNFQVTDNIAITPSVFYLSRPMGQYTNNLVMNGEGYDGQFNIFGGLVQTTFKF